MDLDILYGVSTTFNKMNSKEFSLQIEKIVQERKGISYMDAILRYCEENELDPGTVAPMLTKALKEAL